MGRITPSGIYQYTREQEKIVSNSVTCLFIDSQDQLWCGTSGGITLYEDGEPYMDLEESMGLPSNKIQTIIEDRNGMIWIGTLNGLIRIDFPEVNTYNEEEGLNDLIIHSLAEDSEGNIWIGTFGGGLYRLVQHNQDSVQIMQMVADDRLSSKNIFSLLFQNDSILIVGTERGFDKLFLDRNQKILSVKSYDESNGFSGVENNLNALLNDRQGNYWFGTTFGLTQYDPRLEHVNLNPPKTYITGVKIRYEEIDWEARDTPVHAWFNLPVDPKLKWSENHLTISYAGVSLSNPEKINYKYRLIGLYEEWSPSTRIKEVVYQDLDPGHYEFQVIAENENGIWIKNPARFTFDIYPPFWQRWWFYVLIVLTLLTAAIVLIRIRELQLIRKNRELETKVRERTREISEQKEEIETQRDEIEAQRDEIEIQRDIVIVQNQEIKDSINYAQRIQKAILPQDKYLNAVMPEYFIVYKPRDIVSGDFYWVKEINQYLIIVAADSTGHGIPGAFMSMLGITLLNDHIGSVHLENPADLLSILRLKVKVILAQEGKSDEQKDGMDMALAVYNSDSMELKFAGAYNPLYLIRASTKAPDDGLSPYMSMENKNFSLYELKGDRQPIGIHSLETDFTTHRIQLKKRDSFYMFSDGYVDQFGGEKRKKFKSINFKKLLLSFQDESLDLQKEKIEETFESWKGGNEQVDDICILGVRI